MCSERGFYFTAVVCCRRSLHILLRVNMIRSKFANMSGPYASWLFAPWCRIIVCFLVVAVTALFSDWRPRFTHVCWILFTYTLFTRATLFYSAGTSYGPVSVSVTIRSFIEAAERIGLGFGIGASFDLSYTGFKEIRVPLKIRILPAETSLQTVDIENVATAYRSSKRIINLAREKWTLRAW